MTNQTSLKPTTQQLASIIAQLLPSCAGDLPRATADAVRLWEASAAEIADWQRRIEDCRALDALRAEAASMASEPQMSFDEMLKRLMPRAKVADRTGNFRHYLSDATGTSTIEAGELLGRYATRQFTEFQFEGIRKAFVGWNRRHLAKIRSDAGRKGGRRKHNSK